MTQILSVDPGFDATGWALFDLDRFFRNRKEMDIPQAALASLIKSGTIFTDVGKPDPVRLLQLTDGLPYVASSASGIEIAYIEEPAYSRDYGRGAARENRGDAKPQAVVVDD